MHTKVLAPLISALFWSLFQSKELSYTKVVDPVLARFNITPKKTGYLNRKPTKWEESSYPDALRASLLSSLNILHFLHYISIRSVDWSIVTCYLSDSDTAPSWFCCHFPLYFSGITALRLFLRHSIPVWKSGRNEFRVLIEKILASAAGSRQIQGYSILLLTLSLPLTRSPWIRDTEEFWIITTPLLLLLFQKLRVMQYRSAEVRNIVKRVLTQVPVYAERRPRARDSTDLVATLAGV